MLSQIDRSVQFPNRYRVEKVPGTEDIVDLAPAPGEISEEGTFVNRRASQLLQADRRTYPVKAGQTIFAKNVVNIVGGEVTKAGTPSQAIALENATAGQPCEVIFDGVAELPGLVMGTEIKSRRVYGYCPEDGWLWVRPEWDYIPFIKGTYFGNGATNYTRTITLDFSPMFVIFYNYGSFGPPNNSERIYGNRNVLFLFNGDKVGSGYGEVALSGQTLTVKNTLALTWNGPSEQIKYIAFKG